MAKVVADGGLAGYLEIPDVAGLLDGAVVLSVCQCLPCWAVKVFRLTAASWSPGKKTA